MTPNERFIESLLSLVWSQWTALGVRGSVRPLSPSVAIGLEELMLLTSQLAAHDPRLRDEALDWCVENGKFISKPKLKGLLRTSQQHVSASFAPFATALTEQRGGNWPGAGAKPRWKIVRTHKSSVPDLNRPELVNLKLRELFGVGARADVISALVTWPAPHVVASDLSFLGYTKRNVAVALDWLSAGGLLRHAREGNQVRFSWQRRHQLIDLIEPLPNCFPRWPRITRLLGGFLHLLAANETKSERLAGVRAAKTLAALSTDIHSLGLSPPASTPTSWSEVRDWMVEEARQLERGSSTLFAALGPVP